MLLGHYRMNHRAVVESAAARKREVRYLVKALLITLTLAAILMLSGCSREEASESTEEATVPPESTEETTDPERTTEATTAVAEPEPVPDERVAVVVPEPVPEPVSVVPEPVPVVPEPVPAVPVFPEPPEPVAASVPTCPGGPGFSSEWTRGQAVSSAATPEEAANLAACPIIPRPAGCPSYIRPDACPGNTAARPPSN